MAKGLLIYCTLLGRQLRSADVYMEVHLLVDLGCGLTLMLVVSLSAIIGYMGIWQNLRCGWANRLNNPNPSQVNPGARTLGPPCMHVVDGGERRAMPCPMSTPEKWSE